MNHLEFIKSRRSYRKYLDKKVDNFINNHLRIDEIMNNILGE